MLRSNHLQPGISLNTMFPTTDLTLKVFEFHLYKMKATCIFSFIYLFNIIFII